MKKYIAPEFEVIETPDVVTASNEVETEKIPLSAANEDLYNT